MNTLVIARLLKKVNPKSGFGKSDLENAMAIVRLLNSKYEGLELHRAVINLLKAQNKAGNWQRSIFFYLGPLKQAVWGSEEITTGFCLEALAMSKTQCSTKL